MPSLQRWCRIFNHLLFYCWWNKEIGIKIDKCWEFLLSCFTCLETALNGISSARIIPLNITKLWIEPILIATCYFVGHRTNGRVPWTHARTLPWRYRASTSSPLIRRCPNFRLGCGATQSMTGPTPGLGTPHALNWLPMGSNPGRLGSHPQPPLGCYRP